MQKKIFVICFIIALFVFASVLTMYNPSKDDIKEAVLDNKEVLLSYSYFVIDDYFTEEKKVFSFDEELTDLDYDYQMLFITLICDGSIRSCYGSATSKNDPDRLSLDIKSATVSSIEDNRFGGVLEKKELDDLEVVFTFLFDKEKLEKNDYEYLEDNIEMGIHALEVESAEGDSAFFKESVPISKNYGLEYTLERLCTKIDLSKDAWKDEDTSIYKYETMSFIGNRYNDILDLYRYNILVNVDDLSNNDIKNSITIAQRWFINNINADTGLLEYQYYPSSNSYSTDNNHVRQIASLWSMAELDVFLNTNKFEDVVENTIDYYLDHKESSNGYSYLNIDGYSKLAYNAFIILVLVNAPYYESGDVLLSEFGEGILALQNEDGSYDTYFNSDRNSGVDFYPGEAMLALMKLYKKTDESKYLDSVKKAFPYYRDYWKSNKNTAFIPWHSQVDWLLYQETKDSELVDFVFEMNDWLIDNYQIKNDKYPDKIGGFPKNTPRCSTSSYLEGINDAYSLAVQIGDKDHIEKYKKSIRLGARFILQTQFNEKNTFYLENPDKAIGGFKQSLVRNNLRNDYTQHAVMALMKVYNNDIFE